MAVFQTAEKMLPPGVRAKVSPLLRKLAAATSGKDDASRAQYMALVAFVIRVLSAGIAFASQIILARLMGEFEYGIFAFVWVLVILFGNLSCLGFHTALIRFLPGYMVNEDYAAIRGLSWTSRIFAVVSAGLLTTFGIVFLRLFGHVIESYYFIPVILGLFILPMIALGDIMDGTARANRWAVTALSPTFIIRPLLILAFMLAFIGAGASRTATTAMEAALIATYVTTIGQLVAVSWRLRRHYPHGPLKIDFSVWLRYAFPLFLIDGFGYLLTNSDVVVVGLFLPPDQVAIYFAAAKTIALVQFVFFSVKAGAGPRFSVLMAENDIHGLASFAGQTVRWSFWPSLAIGLVVLAAGSFLLSLFGPAFVAGHMLMAILFAGILAKAMVGPGEVLLSMAGKQQLCVLVYAVALAANIALNVTLIPRFGLTGAAAATATAMMIEALLLHLAVRKTLRIVLFAFADPLALIDRTRAA